MILELIHQLESDFEKNQKRHTTTNILADLENHVIGKVNSAYEIVCWHKKYYEQYPFVASNKSTIIDITCADDVFSKTMQQELELYNSEIFNEVWNKVNV